MIVLRSSSLKMTIRRCVQLRQDTRVPLPTKRSLLDLLKVLQLGSRRNVRCDRRGGLRRRGGWPGAQALLWRQWLPTPAPQSRTKIVRNFRLHQEFLENLNRKNISFKSKMTHWAHLYLGNVCVIFSRGFHVSILPIHCDHGLGQLLVDLKWLRMSFFWYSVCAWLADLSQVAVLFD